MTQDNLYKIGTKHSILRNLYNRNQICKCDTVFLNKDDIPKRKTSLRAANSQQSIFVGQGFLKCMFKKNVAAYDVSVVKIMFYATHDAA